MLTKEDLDLLESRLATKEDLASAEARLATKEDLASAEARLATKEDLASAEARLATKEDLASAEARLATKEGLASVEARLATKKDLVSLRSDLRSEIHKEVEGLAILTQKEFDSVHASLARANRKLDALHSTVTQEHEYHIGKLRKDVDRLKQRTGLAD